MKKIVLMIALFIATSMFAKAQALVDSLYIVTYTTGPSWDQSKSPNDQPYFKEHSARLGQLRKEGIIRFGARYAEKGIIVIGASNLTAAKELVQVDQAVANKLFTADIQKLKIFYDGCLERPK